MSGIWTTSRRTALLRVSKTSRCTFIFTPIDLQMDSPSFGDRRAGLAQGHRQFSRVGEGQPAQVVQQFLVGDAHVSSVADWMPGGQQASVSDDEWR